MRAWRIAQLAVAGLRRAPLRVALTTLGVTIASGAMFTMVAFALGLQHQAETPFRLLDLFKNIQVMPKVGAKKASPLLDDPALARIERIPGVEVVYPDIRIKNLKLLYGKRTVTGLALAMPREALVFATPDEMLAAGRFFSDDSHEILLGKRLVADLGFTSPEKAIGAKVTIEATGFLPGEGASFVLERREIQVIVVGVLDVPPLLPRHAQRAVVLPVELMKDIPRLYDENVLNLFKPGSKPGSNAATSYPSATVRVRNHADLDAVEAKIRSMGFFTRTVLSRFEEMRLFFVFLEVLLGSVGTVALLVAALGIVNTLLMSVLERYQEIGIYKTLGASSGDLVVLFLTEAAIIGLLGGAGGVGLGGGVAYLIELGVNYYAQTRHVTSHLDLFAFPWWLLATTVFFSAVVSVVAGVYPALRAARIDPIRALRRE